MVNLISYYTPQGWNKKKMNSEFLPINTYSNNVVDTGPCTTFRGWNSDHRAFKSIIIFLGLNGEISQLKNSILIMNTYKKKMFTHSNNRI